MHVNTCPSVCVCLATKKTHMQYLVRTKSPHDQSAFDQIMPSDHPLTLSSVRCRPKSRTNTLTQAQEHTYLCMHLLGFLSIQLSLYQTCTHAHALICAHSYAYVPGFKHQWFDISCRASLFMTRFLSPCELRSLRSENQLSLLHTLQTSVPLLPLSLPAAPLDCPRSFSTI